MCVKKRDFININNYFEQKSKQIWIKSQQDQVLLVIRKEENFEYLKFYSSAKARF